MTIKLPKSEESPPQKFPVKRSLLTDRPLRYFPNPRLRT